MTAAQPDPSPALSVIVPVFDAERQLVERFDHLYAVLDGLGTEYEVIFVDGGSRDRSPTLLRQQYSLFPEVTQVVFLHRDAGWQAALMTGFEICRGSRVLVLSPERRGGSEAIPKLLNIMDRNHDFVLGLAPQPQGSRGRIWIRRLMNRIRAFFTPIGFSDTDWVLVGYTRTLVDSLLDSGEAGSLIFGLAYLHAKHPAEFRIEVPRDSDEPPTRLFPVLHQNLQLMTGFSLRPLHLFSLVSLGLAFLAFALAILLVVHQFLIGPSPEGGSPLLVFLLLFCGLVLFGLGLLGQYLAHLLEVVYGQSRARIQDHLGARSDGEP